MILGGTGAIGGATALRLSRAGWQVEVTGRDPAAMPAQLTAAGVRFLGIDRADTPAIERLIGGGVDLLVDAVAFSEADVRALLPAMSSAQSIVVVSSRAVYVDASGRHINGDEPPEFDIPITEGNPTLEPAPAGVDPFSRAGYAPSKVAAERAALDSGLPVTIIRPSKVHGRWARNARTRRFVESMLRGDSTISLAGRGESIDHLTAARNTAALIETVACAPGRRILNSADPDLLTARRIVEAIADYVDWRGAIELLEPGAPGGEHPWQARHPIVLDTTASVALGYEPEGSSRQLLADEVSWLAGLLRRAG